MAREKMTTEQKLEAKHNREVAKQQLEAERLAKVAKESAEWNLVKDKFFLESVVMTHTLARYLEERLNYSADQYGLDSKHYVSLDKHDLLDPYAGTMYLGEVFATKMYLSDVKLNYATFDRGVYESVKEYVKKFKEFFDAHDAEEARRVEEYRVKQELRQKTLAKLSDAEKDALGVK